MKYIPYYIVSVEHYDYFGGHKFDDKKFDTLTEAWDYFKSHLKYIYNYDDGSFYMVKKPILRWEWKKPQHIYHNVRWTKKVMTPSFEDVFNMDEDDEDILILI